MSLIPLGGEACPHFSPFFGFAGAAFSMIFSAIGAAYGTAKSGVGIAGVGQSRPELMMKSLLPVVMVPSSFNRTFYRQELLVFTD